MPPKLYISTVLFGWGLAKRRCNQSPKSVTLRPVAPRLGAGTVVSLTESLSLPQQVLAPSHHCVLGGYEEEVQQHFQCRLLLFADRYLEGST